MNTTLPIQNTDEQLQWLTAAVELEEADENDWREVLESIRDQFGSDTMVHHEPLSPEEKNNLIKEVTLFLCKQLREGTITFDDMPDIASYILSWNDRLVTPSDAADFLFLLKSRWEFFQSFVKVEDTEHLPVREQIEQLAQSVTT